MNLELRANASYNVVNPRIIKPMFVLCLDNGSLSPPYHNLFERDHGDQFVLPYVLMVMNLIWSEADRSSNFTRSRAVTVRRLGSIIHYGP